ncbi:MULTISPECIES: type I 3-dehydroquinate dehydratase [unclassified Methanoregula]|uniref:type I 3-dehydroquinate dehydratase n=1 Tax=unclassified Methanoregula TaxID=2649730 RepID=UPI0009C54D99|nr:MULTISPECIES: type I 3-dehydroquinate dehydratase [unclassified Methanoregula]OPX62590.1 MAG: 3-dehydroquinate dehydratase [Methanoregula sp. PtaB.Bin085]OPY34840.1 MAG: 3-dehydroquinate dehydratase [Methanoregula sp. PtaU1.Bin006]
MKIVAALTDPVNAVLAQEQGADMIELRLDLFEGDLAGHAKRCRQQVTLPIIATLRSGAEGGRYFGNADEWMKQLAPLMPYVDYIDIEQRFSDNAPAIRAVGKQVIASSHEGRMLSLTELFHLERNLRAFGDIPKIIVTPQNEDDLIDLISFTAAAKKPICTGVMGSQYRQARAILPMFGSELVYCSVGAAPTAEGQFTVEEFVQLRNLLGM